MATQPVEIALHVTVPGHGRIVELEPDAVHGVAHVPGEGGDRIAEPAQIPITVTLEISRRSAARCTLHRTVSGTGRGAHATGITQRGGLLAIPLARFQTGAAHGPARGALRTTATCGSHPLRHLPSPGLQPLEPLDTLVEPGQLLLDPLLIALLVALGGSLARRLPGGLG